MRSITAQETKVLSAACGHSVSVRVWVWDGSAYQNVAALEGRNWLVSVEWDEGVDDPCGQATVTLRRRLEDLSLNPLVSNKLTGVLALGRPFYIEAATLPLGDRAEESDYREVFRGKVETLTMDKDPLTFTGRDLAGDLSRAYIETEASYGSSSGVAVETIIQSILTAAGTGVTLYVRNASGGTTTGAVFGPFKQKKMSVLTAVRELALKIGWDLRYVWHDASSSWRFTLIEPDRSAVASSWTFQPSKVKAVTKLSQTLFDVRNAIRLYYYNRAATDAAGVVPLAYVTAEDATSIAAYSRQYMQWQEPEDSPIDSAAEAQVMANAARDDLKDPLLDFGVQVGFFYPVQVGDMLTFAADELHFSTDQTLAVVTLAHRIDGKGHRTTLQLRGKPVAASGAWLARDARVNLKIQPPASAPDPVTALTATATSGGAVITFTRPTTNPVPVEYEVHVSTSSGFTPSLSTLREKADRTSFELTGLTPGTTYYAQVVGRDRVGNRSTAVEVSFSPRYVEPRILQPRVSYNALPLNADFEAQSDTGAPPDGWTISGGTWGVDAITTSTATSGGVALSIAASTCSMRSAAFVAVPGSRYGVRAYLNNAGTGSVNAQVKLRFLDSSLAQLASTTAASASLTAPSGWVLVTGVLTAPANTRYAQVELTKDFGSAIYFDSVSVQPSTIQEQVVEAAYSPPFLNDYQNGWVPYASNGIRYYKDAGRVYIEGFVSSGTIGLAVTTLLTGYRPTRNLQIASSCSSGFAEIGIDTGGVVKVLVGSTTWTSLCGLSFRAAT